jgi:hypothetical protein
MFQIVLLIKERVVSFDYNTRVRTGIILLMALALLSNVRLLLEWIDFDLSFIGQDNVSKFERKFEGARTKLPSNGIIGYRTDTPDDLALYYLTQYTLAPVVVARIPAQQYVINVSRDVNSSEDKPYLDFIMSSPGADFKMFDFQNGIKIIKSEEQ